MLLIILVMIKQLQYRVTKHKKYYLVEIIDTGKGIKPEEIPYIWDKYYKNDKKHQRNVVSTGLGLSIVKQILELHNYEYGVKSVLKRVQLSTLRLNYNYSYFQHKNFINL